MKVCSHQPSFFPWAGYWNKVANSDLVILSAGVKFNYANYQNRVLLNGSWWTIPVRKGAKDQAICEVRFDQTGARKAFKTGRQALCGKRNRNAELAATILAEAEAAVDRSDFLLDLNVAAHEAVIRALGLATRTVVDTTAPIDDFSKTRRLVDRIRRNAPGCTTYLSGEGSVDYIAPSEWPTDIALVVQSPNGVVDSGTALQLIAREDQPVRAIRNLFGWRPANV